uniref:Putative Per a allergen n=1 Tax=Periplaneta americana TaxID=6978 RepID=A0A2P0XIY5_PERAM|nr:putative Per a allergen [Periplaneta americana]
MVSLRRSNSHFCGGSIISNDYILTAAHCVIGASPSSVTVVTGTNTLNAGGSSHEVSSITVHSGYSAANSWRNDIALLKLLVPIAFTSLQSAVTLPAQGENAGAGTACIASGWGYTSYPGAGLPNNLQKVSLSVISNADCQASHTGTIFSTSICASAGAGKGVCNGDSGGPLTSNGKQIGIVSWGRPCATGVPDVYTRVSEYITWINQNAV